MSIDDFKNDAAAEISEYVARASDHGLIEADRSPDGEKTQDMAVPANHITFASSQRPVSMLGWGLMLALGSAGWFLLLSLVQ